MEFYYENLFLDPDAPRRRYIDGELCETCIHWGQRKLILSEIEFLTIFWGVSKTGIVVYAGSAPGNHIPLLAELFPQLSFELYDPAPFAIRPTSQIKIHNEFFTRDVAQQWQGRENVVFISDIRGVDPRKNTRLVRDDNLATFDPKEAELVGKRDTESKIWDEMKQQQEWVEIIQPAQAMLKFRLPWVVEPEKGDVIAPYLDGHVLMQCYAPLDTTETRLVPRQPLTSKEWSCLQYEEQLHHHNFIIRDQQYLNPLTNTEDPIDPPELLNDFDSTLELFILAIYSDAVGRRNDVIALSRYITDQINGGARDRWTLDRIRKTSGRSTSRRTAEAMARQTEPRSVPPRSGRYIPPSRRRPQVSSTP